jgi:DNA-binding GntR family transcriptional regulator
MSVQVTYGDTVSVVDHDSNVPPYRQVASILRARIESGELAPRQRLPSIAGLVQEYGIARTTAAKALRVLVDEGLAEVVQGWGTYVTSEDQRPKV